MREKRFTASKKEGDGAKWDDYGWRSRLLPRVLPPVAGAATSPLQEGGVSSCFTANFIKNRKFQPRDMKGFCA
jgi:hypothetical protein